MDPSCSCSILERAMLKSGHRGALVHGVGDSEHDDQDDSGINSANMVTGTFLGTRLEESTFSSNRF